MPTKCTKPVTREMPGGTIFQGGKDREVIVTLQPPNVVTFRLKGCRQTFSLTTDALWFRAVAASVETEKRNRQMNRTAKRTVARGRV